MSGRNKHGFGTRLVHFGSRTANTSGRTDHVIEHDGDLVGMGFLRGQRMLNGFARLRHDAIDGVDYHTSADLTGQANHLGVTIEADIIKQKLPENNGGFKALNSGGSSYGKLDERIYSQLTSEHPIDLTRYQVANCYMGRSPLINSGGASAGESDLKEAVRTAVINKRAGGMGLISGRKAFQRPLAEGVALLNAIQDVYLSKDITIA